MRLFFMGGKVVAARDMGDKSFAVAVATCDEPLDLTLARNKVGVMMEPGHNEVVSRDGLVALLELLKA